MAKGFIGVSYEPRRKKWQAYTKVDGKKKTFGNHDTAMDAARAYDEGVKGLGLDKPLNFPAEPKNIPITDAPAKKVGRAKAAATAKPAPQPTDDMPFPVTPEQIDAAVASQGQSVEKVEPLSDVEKSDYARLKSDMRTLTNGLGSMLSEVQTRRLYREEFKTFEEFVRATFDHTRQWAYQLIDAQRTASTLEQVGVTPTNEREARELKGTAQIVDALTPEARETMAKFIQAATGSEKPTTSQVKAVAEVVAALDKTGTVEHPETGATVKFTELPEQARMAVVRENVTNNTHERMQRQQGHIQESQRKTEAMNSTKAPSGKTVQAASWSDWCMNYGDQALTHEQRLEIIVEKDPSGNAKARARVVDKTTGEVISEGEPGNFLKAAVMSLIEEVKGGGNVQ